MCISGIRTCNLDPSFEKHLIASLIFDYVILTLTEFFYYVIKFITFFINDIRVSYYILGL